MSDAIDPLPADAVPDHRVEYEHEHEHGRSHGALVTRGGTRARCSCGWFSDCYAMISSAQRAVEAHLRQAQRSDFDAICRATQSRRSAK